MAADDRQNTGTPGRAVVCVRISDDPDRLERGVERQEEDCRAFADRLGLDVVQVLRENDTSACSVANTEHYEFIEAWHHLA